MSFKVHTNIDQKKQNSHNNLNYKIIIIINLLNNKIEEDL